VTGGLIVLLPPSAPVGAVASQNPASAALSGEARTQRALLDRYCVSCHNARNKANVGNLDLAAMDIAKPSARTDIAEKMVAKLRAGLMPPAGNRRPAATEYAALISYLETDLDAHAEVAPNPGRTDAFHRLNRAEYRNAVRDLFGLEMDVTSYLPSDDASFGFDNIAGVLKISQSRLEQYLGAARRISRAAIGSPLQTPASSEYRVRETTQQYQRMPGLPFGTRGGMLIKHDFPQDGEYDVNIDLMCRLGGECDGSVGFPDEHHLLVLVDGEQVKSFTLEPRKLTDFRAPAERTWKVRVPLKAGPHDIGVTFEKLPSIREIDSAYERFQRPYVLNGVIGQPNQTIYQPFLDVVTVVGPFNPLGSGTTPSRQRIFTCYPKTKADEEPCVKTILGKLTRRAYRRPVTDADIAPMLAIYRSDASSRGFEAGIETALQRLLISPEFLYRVEKDPPSAKPNSNYTISDLEFASRLSFFLWSSIPDETLLTLAQRGTLKDPAVLAQQVTRMLADSRADALIENFTGQWLLLRNLDAQRPDLPLFPNFDDTLRAAERRETELFFGSILRENRPVTALLTADYTFVNERLARHYGMPNIYGNDFRRVTVADEHRRGLLGQASILTVTSRPNRTSPVLRGKFILDNIMGTPPPQPPANVPSLKEPENGQRTSLGTMRERMIAHRVNPVCAGCHSMIEPPGLALENFDAIGRWREVDDTQMPIDASGSLPDGTKFDGLNTFKATLLRDPAVFATTVTTKLMTYALGRGLEPDAGHEPGVDDMPAVRRIVRDATPGGLKLSALVVGIVRSVPFQMRRTPFAQ
jgi:hypothetical protein